MKTRHLFPLFIVLCLLSACTAPAAAPTATPLPSLTLVPTAKIPTVTVTNPATAMVLPTNAAQLALTAPPAVFNQLGQTRIEQRCVETVPTLSFTATLTGTVVLHTVPQTQNEPVVYLLRLSDNTRMDAQPLDGQSHYAPTVSPDGKWLAYYRRNQGGLPSELIIVDLKGRVYKKTAWDQDWFALLGWLNAEKLLIAEKGGEVVFDPFTEQKETFGRDYPNLDDYPPPVSWDLNDTVYDPGLSLVVYPLRQPDNGGAEVVLWDIGRQRVLASLPNVSHYGRTPRWSPSGDSVIVTGIPQAIPAIDSPTEDLFRIYRDGKIARLTYFSDGNESVGIGNYSWSPDEHYLAFWLWAMNKDYTEGEHLVVLDLLSGEVVDYCLLGNSGGFSAAPIWSPNNQYLLVESHEVIGAEGTVFLVDLSNNRAVPITQNMRPIGWMIAP